MIEKEFVCMKEAAEILGIDSRTMKKILLGNNNIHYIRTKSKILINKSELLEAMKNSSILRY